MDSPSRLVVNNPTNSPVRITVKIEARDSTLSPVYTSVFDLETVLLSPSSVSNLSATSDVPTVVFPEAAAAVALPVSIDSDMNGEMNKWYAIRKSIHGRRLMTNSWEDCEPHVKVQVDGKKEKVFGRGVDFKSFLTFEDAVVFLFHE